MSLSPTLLTQRAISPSIGSVIVSTVAVYILNNYPTPAQALISVAGLQPSVSVDTGPIARPGLGLVRFSNSAVSLGISLTIYPELLEADSVDNNLIPTILLGTSSSAGIPTTAYARITGLAPTLLRDAAAFAFPGVGTGVMVTGLIPTLGIPPANETTKDPRLGNLDMIALAPTLLTSLTQGIDIAAAGSGITITGLVPHLAYKSGWETVALSGASVWTDVPPAF